MPILLAVSPLAAMRSAPTTTSWTRPSFITWAAMLSQISVTSMPRLLQLPGGQPGALEQRPGLVGEDAEAPALLGGGEDDGQGRAVVGRRQAAGVAVRQDALRRRGSGRRRPRPIARHIAAVFLVDGLRLVEQPSRQLGRRQSRAACDAPLHAVQRPEQVDGRRPAGAQVVGDLVEPLA